MRDGPATYLARLLRLPPGHGTLVLGIALAALILAASIAGPALYGHDPFALHPGSVLARPQWRFPFGTDDLGRNAMARLLAAGRSTLYVALPAAALAFAAGTLYGLVSGFGPRLLDQALMRLLDAVLALPGLVILIFFGAIVPLNTPSLILLLGLISWPPLARLVRNETLAQRERDFVHAARQLGGGFAHIATTHLLRVMAPVLVVNFTFLVGDMIFALSALSFLGLGVQPPQTSWGGLLQEGLELVALDPWWLILPPGLMIFGAMLATSLIGQGLLARGSAAR
jgi:peptide/nickel transport system permease protein